MKEVLYYNALYDCYQSLLTEKQRAYYESYYFYNLSFGEIAFNENKSRNAIYKQVKDVCKKLEDYEQKLHLYKLKRELSTLKEDIKEKNIQQRITKIIEELD